VVNILFRGLIYFAWCGVIVIFVWVITGMLVSLRYGRCISLGGGAAPASVCSSAHSRADCGCVSPGLPVSVCCSRLCADRVDRFVLDTVA
jgi:hypothetical protein